MLKDKLYAGGLALEFYAITELEKVPREKTAEDSVIQARNLLRILMGGWNDQWHTLLNWQTIQAIFLDRNHLLTQSLRLAFQQGFNHVFSQLRKTTLTTQQLNQAQLFISNCLTFLPFADMTQYESFAIPQYVKEGDTWNWQLVDYKVTPIELTPTSGFKKLFLEDEDRVFAYGLEPINQPSAEPHLIFMGTTYPAGQGFATTIDTDMEAFETAGKKLYRTGRENIRQWLDQQTKKVHVCGTSLGGSLSLLLAIDQGDKLSRVDALNPAGLYKPWYKSRFDHWDSITEKPAVFIQKQGNDPVSRFGVWKKEWDVLHVIPQADRKGPNAFTDHVLNYAGLPESQYVVINTERDNQEHKWRNILLYTLMRSTTYYFVMVPYRYLYLPTIRFVLHHKLQLALMIPFIALFITIPTLLITVSSSFIINALLSATIASYLLKDLIQYVSDRFTNKHHSDLSKFLTLLAERPLLNKVVGLLATVGIASVVVASIFFPPLIFPNMMIMVATIPFASCAINKIGEKLQILLGYNKPQLPKYQHPDLARNKSLDIYTNTTQATFTYKEIGEYYHARRSLLKDKRNQPLDCQKLFKTTGLTKGEVLRKSQDPTSGKDKITFFATKAKIFDIQKTVRLVQQFGVHQDDKLIPKLQQHHQEYIAGKP